MKLTQTELRMIYSALLGWDATETIFTPTEAYDLQTKIKLAIKPEQVS